MNTGLIYIVIAEFFWALELILIRKYFPTQSSILIAGLTSIIASLFYLPTFLFAKEKITTGNWLILFILGLTSFFLAQIFYVKGIQEGPSAFTIALATLTMPLLALIMATIFFKESISTSVLVGGALMIVAFLIISFK